MSTEGVKNQSEVKESVKRTAPTDRLRKNIRIMRNVTVALTVLALAEAATLVFVGVTLLIASNIGLESLSSIPIPWNAIVGLAAFVVVVLGARTYTAMKHKELLAELHIAFSK